MKKLANVKISPDEYVAFERLAEYKSEYVDGLVNAMYGASLPHNTIVAINRLHAFTESSLRQD